MIVVLAIVSLILTVVLGSQSKYSDRLNLKNQAYNVALFIREAQVYSLGVKNSSPSGTQQFNSSYGIAFQTASPNSIIFFIDKNLDGRYTDASELIEQNNFVGGITVNNYCGTNSSGVEDCSTPQLRTIDITFLRPNPIATVLFHNPGGQLINSLYPPSRVELRSPNGALVSIKVDSTGQISIQ